MVKLGYGVETTAGTKPASFTWLERCNTISGIELSTETIDSSALEDLVSKSVAGRQDSGGTWNITFNYTSEVETQLTAMISAYNTAHASDLKMWFEVWMPNTTNAFFVVAQPPQKLPMPEFGQNALLTIQLGLAIDEYKGTSAGVEPVG